MKKLFAITTLMMTGCAAQVAPGDAGTRSGDAPQAVEVAPVGDPTFDYECTPTHYSTELGRLTADCIDESMPGYTIHRCAPELDGSFWIYVGTGQTYHVGPPVDAQGHNGASIMCNIQDGVVTGRRSAGTL